MSISNQAMVINCHFGMWEGHRLDKQATRELTAKALANDDAARVNKHLVAKEWLAPIVTARSALRTQFITMTLPWKDNGDRLLPRPMFEAFIEEHEKLAKVFRAEVDKFLTTGYPTAIDQAEFRMGSLFKPDDYPPVEVLRPKFYVNLVIDAVTEAKDFRVTMSKDQVTRIQKEMEEATNARIAKAMGDVWQRVGKALGHFAQKMADEEAVFRDSTLDNLVGIVEMLPAMNIMNDPNLAKIGEDIRDAISGIEVKELRKDKMVRKAAAKATQRIFADVQSFSQFTSGDDE